MNAEKRKWVKNMTIDWGSPCVISGPPLPGSLGPRGGSTVTDGGSVARKPYADRSAPSHPGVAAGLAVASARGPRGFLGTSAMAGAGAGHRRMSSNPRGQLPQRVRSRGLCEILGGRVLSRGQKKPEILQNALFWPKILKIISAKLP